MPEATSSPGTPGTEAIKFYDHPRYAKLAELWQEIRDLYEGDHETLCSPRYLWPHELELSTAEAPSSSSTPTTKITIGQKYRQIRCQRSRYFGLLETLTSNWVSMALAKPIKIDDAVKTLLGDQMNDIDGEGTSLENFIKGPLATAYFRDGRPLLAVDSPGGEFGSLAEQKAAGFRPFFEMLDVLEVRDWQTATQGPRVGKFDFIRTEFKSIEPRSSSRDEPKEVCYTKELRVSTALAPDGQTKVPVVTAEVFKKNGDNWELAEEPRVLKGFQEIPVATVHCNDPWTKDLVPLQMTLHNLISAWLNNLNMQAFQRVLISADGMNEQHQMAVSEFAWSRIPAGAKVDVINPCPTDGLENAMAWFIDQMYRVAFNRNRGLAGSSKEAPGADTIKEMNAELVELLKMALGEIEAIVNQGLRYYAQFMGDADFAGQVTLSKDLSVEDVGAQVEKYLAYKDDMKKVLSWYKAEMKRVALQGGYSEEEEKKILAEIDKITEEKLNPLAGMNPAAAFGKFGLNGRSKGPEEAESPEETGQSSSQPGGRPDGGSGAAA